MINPVTEAKTYISLNEILTVFADKNVNPVVYWLATEGAIAGPNMVIWGIGAVGGIDDNFGVVCSISEMFTSVGEGGGGELGICPVVCLKDEIPPKINAPEIIRPVE